jgi:hypothetical protein
VIDLDPHRKNRFTARYWEDQLVDGELAEVVEIESVLGFRTEVFNGSSGVTIWQAGTCREVSSEWSDLDDIADEILKPRDYRPGSNLNSDLSIYGSY